MKKTLILLFILFSTAVYGQMDAKYFIIDGDSSAYERPCLGVKSVRTGNWLIEKKYQSINVVNKVVFALYIDTLSEEAKINGDIAIYDTYLIKNNEILATAHNGLRRNSQIPYELIFSEEFNVEKDPRVITTFSKNQKGLTFLQLFSEAYYNDYSLVQGSYVWPDFKYKVVFENEFEFVAKIGPNEFYFAAYNEKGFTLKKFDNYDEGIFEYIIDAKQSVGIAITDFETGDQFLQMDSCFFYTYDEYNEELDNNISTYKKYYCRNNSSINYANYGIEKLDHDRYYIHCFLPENIFVIEAFDPETGDFKYDEFGNPIFIEIKDKGTYASGVYNAKLNLWEIEPSYAHIVFGYEGMLLQQPILNDTGYVSYFEFSLLDYKGKYLLHNVRDSIFYDSDENIKLLIPEFKVDSLRMDKICTFYSNGKMGFASTSGWNDGIELIVLVEPVDYAAPFTDGGFLKIDDGALFSDSIQGGFSKGNYIKYTDDGVFALIDDDQSNFVTTSKNAGVIDDYNYFLLPESDGLWHYSAIQLTDSLLLITDWTDEEAFFTIDDNGYEEETFFHGDYKSGMLNVKNNKWVIADEFRKMYPVKNGIFYEMIELDSNSLVQNATWNFYPIPNQNFYDTTEAINQYTIISKSSDFYSKEEVLFINCEEGVMTLNARTLEVIKTPCNLVYFDTYGYNALVWENNQLIWRNDFIEDTLLIGEKPNLKVFETQKSYYDGGDFAIVDNSKDSILNFLSTSLLEIVTLNKVPNYFESESLKRAVFNLYTTPSGNILLSEVNDASSNAPFNKAGVYNTNNNQWLVAPHFKRVYVDGNNYLAESEMNEMPENKNEYQFIHYDENGKIIQLYNTFEELPENLKVLVK